MAHRSEYDKYYSAMTLVGCLLVIVNLYYYVHPLLSQHGLTAEIADLIVNKLRSGGVFVTPYRTKLIGIGLISAGLVTQTGKGSNVGWITVIVAALVGAGLYLFPYCEPLLYLITTCVGSLIFGWAIATAGRKFSAFNEAINDRNETFDQCRDKILTPDSINIPMKFQYRYRWRKGWINVINPYRATMVLGTPGSGKSFSVYGPFIEQMIAKGYSMFVYDYKFPDLTEVVYNEYIANLHKYDIIPEFCVINFNDPTKSLRCNPLNPDYIKDPADTTEIADLVMLNVNKAAVEKEDFFTLSAKVYLDALIWFLKIYEDGRYCTFPHVIELMAQDYKKVFSILSRYPELEAKIKPFSNALEGGAQDQLQGQIASAQIPLNKFVSPSLYWVLTGDDFTLDINDPLHPKILCVGNDPDRQAIYGTTLALFTSRMFKLINHKGKRKCGVLLDELPTIFLKGLDNLIATARSNLVAIVLGAQDKSQLKRDYGEKESEVIFNTVGNIFAGQVNGKTAEDLSKSFGKEFRKRESQTRGIEQDSVNISFQHEELLPLSTIETLSQGVFFGKVADNNDSKINEKFFCGEIQRDLKLLAKKKKSWQKVPKFTDFGEEAARNSVFEDPDAALLDYFITELEKGIVIYQPEDMEVQARIRIDALSSTERNELLDRIATRRYNKAVRVVIEQNFKRIQDEVKGIIDRECRQSQQINIAKPQSPDPRMVDAFAD
jgi:hypothetical protein